MRQNYLRKVPLYPNFREKAIQEAMRAAEEARKNAENAVNGIFDGIKNMFK